MGSKISRRQFLAGAAGALSAAGMSCARLQSPSSAKPQAARPNILFYYPDQLRAAALGCYGGTNVPTPNIDRLANQGVLFSNSISTCPVCTPYRGMLITGRYPTHTGAMCNFVNINPGEYSIAEAFNDAGYHTGYIGKWHLSSGRLTSAGLHAEGLPEEEAQAQRDRIKAYAKANPETEYVPPGPDRQGFKFWAAYNFHCSFNKAFYYRDTPERLVMPRHETDSETDIAIEYMSGRAAANEPFMLIVAPHPPHPPMNANSCPQKYFDNVKQPLDWRPNATPPSKDALTSSQAYYAMISQIDENVGRIMDYLEESGLAENTIFVITSDHGEMLHSHDMRNKMVPYAEAVDVPLIMRWPGRIPAGKTSDALFAPIDHMPTLLSLAGAAAPDAVDGMDLSETVQGRSGPQRDALLMMNYISNWDYFDSGTRWPEWRGVRTKKHTYIKWLDGKEELYNNLNDPYQMDNLALSMRRLKTLEDLRARLGELLAEAHDEFLPGTEYGKWFDDERNLVRTALGPVG